MNKQTNTDPNEILTQADMALQAGQWDEAWQLYHQVFDQPQAQEMLEQLENLKEMDKQVQALIQTGDKQFRARNYQQAKEAYRRALKRAGQANILRYQAALEHKRNQAHDLLGWQQQVEDVLARVEQYNQEKTWPAAYQVLSGLLEKLPWGEYYSPWVRDLEQQLERVGSQLDEETRYQWGREAVEKEDFRPALRLLETILPESAHYQAARNLMTEAQTYFETQLEPILTQVEAAYQQGRWAEAMGHLEVLKTQSAADNPTWRRYWLVVSQARGQAELNRGRQANMQKKFKTAQNYFKAAQQSFKKGLEVDQTQVKLVALDEEATDLSQINTRQLLAQIDWHKGETEKALNALENALILTERAQMSGRDYATVAAVINSMRQTPDEAMGQVEVEAEEALPVQKLPEMEETQEYRGIGLDQDGPMKMFDLRLDAHESLWPAEQSLPQLELEVDTVDLDSGGNEQKEMPSDQIRLSQAGPKSAAAEFLTILNPIRIKLRLVETLDEAQSVLEDLEALSSGQINWNELQPEQQQTIFQLLKQAQKQKEAFRTGQSWEIEAEKALAAQNYAKAAAALEQALKLNQSGQKQVELESRWHDIKAEADKQQERADAVQKGQRLLADGEYAPAQKALNLANILGAEVDELLNAAQAGVLLEQAYRNWRSELVDILKLTHENSYAKEISQDVRRLQNYLQQDE